VCPAVSVVLFQFLQGAEVSTDDDISVEEMSVLISGLFMLQLNVVSCYRCDVTSEIKIGC